MNTQVYLDNAASTPVDPEVSALMGELLSALAGTANPSAEHAAGRAAAAFVEQARGEVAALIHADPGEIIFTSGATESDNLAIIGAARFRRSRGRHIVTSAIEHPAVLQSCRALEAEGFRVTYVQPDEYGCIAVADVATALTPETILVSIMHANNEIGTVQNIGAVGRLCREHGVLLHVDAAQTAGRLPLDVRQQCIDLLSLSAHKIYGPKGVGALFLDRERCRRVTPLFHGGGQERGLRPGTIPTHQVAGMGRAFALAAARLVEDASRITALRERLWAGLAEIPGILLNGPADGRVCHILNVSIPGVDGESLRLALRDIALASGSACAADSGEPSGVLRAIGRPEQLALASLRLSLGRQNTAEEVDFVAERVRKAVARLRSLSPTGA